MNYPYFFVEAIEKLIKSKGMIQLFLNGRWHDELVLIFSKELNNLIAPHSHKCCLVSWGVGRKNYYGSGSVWSAELAAALLTLFGTLKLWELNIHTWLLGYFYECALLGGKPPENIQKYLPWNMSEEKKKLFSEPPKHEDSG